MPIWLTILLTFVIGVVFTLPAWWPEGNSKENGHDEKSRGNIKKRK